MAIEVSYAHEKYFASFYETLTSVASERIYLEMVQPPPLDKVAEFQRNLIVKNAPVSYALDQGRVIGWCDAVPLENPRLAHRASLGMGVLKEYRGQGIGSRLLSHTLEHAKTTSLEKIELTVYTVNIAALALYKKWGFKQEGLVEKYRKLDEQYFDCFIMGKFI